MAKISMDWWWVCRGLYMGLPWVVWWIYHRLYVGLRWVQVFAMLYVFLPWVLIGFGGEWLFWVWVGGGADWVWWWLFWVWVVGGWLRKRNGEIEIRERNYYYYTQKKKIVLNYDLFGHFGLICFLFMHIRKDEEKKDEDL